MHHRAVIKKWSNYTALIKSTLKGSYKCTGNPCVSAKCSVDRIILENLLR